MQYSEKKAVLRLLKLSCGYIEEKALAEKLRN